MLVGQNDSTIRSIQTLFTVGTIGALTDAKLLELFVSRRDGMGEAATVAAAARYDDRHSC